MGPEYDEPMPEILHELVEKPKTAISFATEPVVNALNGMFCLGMTEAYSGFDEGLIRAAERLTPRRLRDNRLLFGVLGEVLHLDEPAPQDFPAFLAALKRQDPEAMRDRYLETVCRIAARLRAAGEDVPSASPAEILDDPAVFAAHVHVFKHMPDADPGPLLAEAHALLAAPKALQRKLVAHLDALWQAHFAESWRRALPRLEAVVYAFEQREWGHLGPIEAARVVLGRELLSDHLLPLTEAARRLVFVPSPYLGPYAMLVKGEGTVWFLSGARFPDEGDGSPMVMSRSDLLNRLTALADETRMGILELVLERGEVTTQMVMDELKLGQSTASRQLIHLCVAGLLQQRRVNRFKHYAFHPGGIDAVCRTLRRFVSEA